MKLSTRAIIGAFLLLGISGYMAWDSAWSNMGALERGQVPINASAFDSRLEPIRPMLAGQPLVRYLTDDKDPRNYCMSRYALSPVRLTLEGKTPLAVGDFRNPKNLANPKVLVEFARQNGYVIEKDFGDGLFLFRSAAAPQKGGN